MRPCNVPLDTLRFDTVRWMKRGNDMAKKRTARRASTTRSKTILPEDFSSWNFVIFLTLAFILLVIVAINLKNVSLDLRARAGLACRRLEQLPRPEDCPGGTWEYQRDTNGCPAFFCNPNPTPGSDNGQGQ